MRVEEVVYAGRCQLRLNYAGRSYPLGALLSDGQRESWVRELRGLVRVERAKASTDAAPQPRANSI